MIHRINANRVVAILAPFIRISMEETIAKTISKDFNDIYDVNFSSYFIEASMSDHGIAFRKLITPKLTKYIEEYVEDIRKKQRDEADRKYEEEHGDEVIKFITKKKI